MTDELLPFISLPNDLNESDVWLILANGEKIKASEAMAKYPILKTLVQKKLKLMASDSIATIDRPQSWIAAHERRNYASLSFYCSKDNYNRDTSASIVFAEGQAKKFEDLIARVELPRPLAELQGKMLRLVIEFSFLKEIASDSQLPPLKKKTFFLILLLLLLTILLATVWIRSVD